MRVNDRARVTYAAATPAVRKASGARQHAAEIADNGKALSELFARLAGSRGTRKLNYLFGSPAHVMRTRRLHARLHVFVSIYQWHKYTDINMFVDDAP
jgi:hypothetical protein